MLSWFFVSSEPEDKSPPQSLAGRIPPELLLMVLAKLQPEGQPWIHHACLRTLASVCLTCRNWLAAGQDALYRHVRLSTPAQCDLFARTLRTRPSLADLVFELQLPGVPLLGMPMLRKRDASPMYFSPWAQLSHELLGDRDGHTPALVEIMTRCRKLRAVAAPTHALKTGERVFHISSSYSKPSSTLCRIHLRGPGVTEHRIPFQDVVDMLGFFSHEPIEELHLSNYWCDQPKGRPAPAASIAPFPRLRRFAFESCWIHEEGMELLLLGTQAPITALELRFTAHLVVNIHGIIDLAHRLPALRELAFFHHETRKLLDFARLEIFETRGPTRRDYLMVYPPPNIHTLKLRHTTPRIDPHYWVADIASQLLRLYLPRCQYLRHVDIHVPVLRLTDLASWRTATLILDHWFPNIHFSVQVQLVRTRLVPQKTRMQRLFGNS